MKFAEIYYVMCCRIMPRFNMLTFEIPLRSSHHSDACEDDVRGIVEGFTNGIVNLNFFRDISEIFIHVLECRYLIQLAFYSCFFRCLQLVLL